MEDTHDLIERLMVVAACYMEDAAAVVLLQSEHSLAERVAMVLATSRKLAAIGAAAETLQQDVVDPGA